MAVLLVGVSITLLVALLQRSSAERERALLFEGAVAEELDRFEGHVDARIEQFDNGVKFINATFPSSPSAFRMYFDDTAVLSDLTKLDPGLLLIEEIAPADLERLSDREATLGDPNFRVLAMGPLFNEHHYVVTRSAHPVEIGGLSIRGMDIGSIGSASFAADLPQSGRIIFALKDASILQDLLSGFTDEESDELLLVIILEAISPHPDAGDSKAWAAQFLDPVLFLRQLTSESDPAINVSATMLGVTEVISGEPSMETSTFDNASLRREIDGDTDGLLWTLNIWANDDFGVKTGLFDQVQVLAIGFAATAAAVLASTGDSNGFDSRWRTSNLNTPEPWPPPTR